MCSSMVQVQMCEELWHLSDAELTRELAATLTARTTLDAHCAQVLAQTQLRGVTDPGALTGPHPAAFIRDHSPTALGRTEAGRLARRVWTREQLPKLAKAHDRAEVSTAFLDAAGTGLGRLPAEARESLDDVLAGAGRDCDPGQVRFLVDQLRIMVDPELADGTANRDAGRSRVTLDPFGSDGAYALSGTLYGIEAERLHALLNAMALTAQRGGDTRVAPQRRAEALFSLARIGERACDDPEFVAAPHGGDVHVTVMTTPQAWAGEAGAPTATTSAGNAVDPGQLAAIRCCTTADELISTVDGPSEAGLSSDEAELIRRALAGLLTHPLGYRIKPLVFGRARRTASHPQWQALQARDRHCVHPRCDASPIHCQAHHLREHDAYDGCTDLVNLGLLCWRHHLELHRTHRHLHPPWCACHPSDAWTIELDPPQLDAKQLPGAPPD